MNEIGKLLALVRSCENVPRPVIQLVKLLETDDGGDGATPCSQDLEIALAGCNHWLAEKGLPVSGSIKIPTPAPPSPEARGKAPDRSVAPSPPGMVWADLVQDLRLRLLEGHPRDPFADWRYPQARGESRWTEAFDVLSDPGEATATVLIPAEDAKGSDDAQRCWQHRRLAADRLRNHGALLPLVARVLDCGSELLPGYVILERPRLKMGSLLRRLTQGDSPSVRQLIELGIALCETLGYLNGLGVTVLDLSPSWVAFEASEGFRFTQLMDPTAVIPARGVLPEYRGWEVGLADFSMVPEPSQVFLVGGLVLASLCDTAETLQIGSVTSGRSASFACLAGRPELADERAERIAEPLITDLERTARSERQTLDARDVVDVLRWCLTERRNQRFSTLAELAGRLRRLTR